MYFLSYFSIGLHHFKRALRPLFFFLIRKSEALLILFRGVERQRKGSMVGVSLGQWNLLESSIGHVGYIRTGFSYGTIEGIHSLLIGIFFYMGNCLEG